MVFINSGVPLPHYPNKPEIKILIENLSEDTDSFIIGESDDGVKYIECSRNNDKYILRYNYWEKLYTCMNDELTTEQLTQIFDEFSATSNNWQANLIWRPEDLNNLTPYSFPQICAWLSPKKTLIIIAIGLLVFLVGYFLKF